MKTAVEKTRSEIARKEKKSEKKLTSTLTPKVKKSTRDLQDALFEDAASSSLTKKRKNSREQRDDSPLQVEKPKGSHDRSRGVKDYIYWSKKENEKLIEHILDCQKKGVRLFFYDCKFKFLYLDFPQVQNGGYLKFRLSCSQMAEVKKEC